MLKTFFCLGCQNCLVSNLFCMINTHVALLVCFQLKRISDARSTKNFTTQQIFYPFGAFWQQYLFPIYSVCQPNLQGHFCHRNSVLMFLNVWWEMTSHSDYINSISHGMTQCHGVCVL